MSTTPEDALSILPDGLKEDVLHALDEILRNYRERRWEPSELNGGKLCEAVYTVIVGFLEGGAYPDRASKPSRFPQACLALEQRFQAVPDSRSPRILIPRMMVGLYDIRNNRGVGHVGADVDPNHMDATVVVSTSKWLVAELVRLLHKVTTEEATSIVDQLIEREAPWVWGDGHLKRVLRAGLTWREQTLILLLSTISGTTEENLLRWLEHPSPGDFRHKILRPLHKSRLIEYDSDLRSVILLPPGITAAEDLLHAGGPS